MKNQDFFELWVERTIKGEDGERKNGTHWCRDDIYFYQKTAACRLFPRPFHDDEWVMLRRWTIGNIPERFRKIVKPMHVVDLGVMSHYETDFITLDNLHPREMWLFIMQIEELADKIVPNVSGEDLQNKRHQQDFRKQMDQLYADYRAYSDLFGLGWSTLPEGWRERMEKTIVEKAAAWNDPKAVAKRQRTAAKRQAIKVLGLD